MISVFINYLSERGCTEMSKIQMYSQKLGKNITVETNKKANTVAMGWSNSGWSKSGGWKRPQL